MKKTIVIVAIYFIAFPLVTNAAWWNPFSWSIFHKADTKTQVLEKRIAELESKLVANATTTTIATSTPNEISATTTPVVRKEFKKVAPVIDNSAIIQAQVKAQVEAQIKAKADQDALIARQKAEEQARIETALKAQAELQAAQAAANLAEQRAEQERITQYEAQQLQAKQDKLDTVNLKIANLNAKYAQDMKEIRTQTGLTSGQKDVIIRNLDDIYTENYNVLMAEYQQVKYSN